MYKIEETTSRGRSLTIKTVTATIQNQYEAVLPASSIMARPHPLSTSRTSLAFSRQSSYQSRPPPPTPRRMANREARKDVSQDRRNSISSIPRPSTGTSRRQTLTLLGAHLGSTPEIGSQDNCIGSRSRVCNNVSVYSSQERQLRRPEPVVTAKATSLVGGHTQGDVSSKTTLSKSYTAPDLHPRQKITSHRLMQPIFEPAMLPQAHANSEHERRRETILSSENRIEADTHSVFVHEPIMYWAGRFNAALDRARNRDTKRDRILADAHNQFSNVELQTRRSSAEFDKNQCDLKRRVVATLKSHCQTGAALEGFEAFRKQLYKTDADFSNSDDRSQANPSSKDAVRRVSGGTLGTNATRKSLSRARKISNSLSQIMARGVSNARMPILNKSNTTTELNNLGIWKVSATALSSRTTGLDLSDPQRSHEPVARAEVYLAQPESIPKARPSLPTSTVTDSQHSAQSSSYHTPQSSATLGSLDSAHAAYDHHMLGTLRTIPSIHNLNQDSPVMSSARLRKHRTAESMRKLVESSIRSVKSMGKRSGPSLGSDVTDDPDSSWISGI